MKTKEWSKLNFFSLQNCLLGTYIKNIIAFTFWCMAILLDPHSVHTQWGAQKLCKLTFLRNQTMKLDHGKRPSSMVRLHGPWCKPALKNVINTLKKTYFSKRHKIPHIYYTQQNKNPQKIMQQLHEIGFYCSSYFVTIIEMYGESKSQLNFRQATHLLVTYIYTYIKKYTLMYDVLADWLFAVMRLTVLCAFILLSTSLSLVNILYVGVIWFILRVLQLLPIRLTHLDLCCIRKSMIKHLHKLDGKSDFPWFSYGCWKCMFVHFLTEYTCSPNCVHFLSVE